MILRNSLEKMGLIGEPFNDGIIIKDIINRKEHVFSLNELMDLTPNQTIQKIKDIFHIKND